MSILDMKEINKLDEKNVKSQIAALKKELFTLKIQRATSGIEKPHTLKDVKKNIARLLTSLNNRN